MPMTSLFSHVATILEAQMRPGLAGFIEREYKARSGNQAPTVLRVKELEDKALNAMRLKLEQCFDRRLEAGTTKNQCLLAIRLEIANELDKEFPKIVIASA